jgi:hypothetical protein
LLDLGSLLLSLSVIAFAMERFEVLGELIGLSLGLLCYMFALGMMLGVLSTHVLRDLPQIAGTAAGLMGALKCLLGIDGLALFVRSAQPLVTGLVPTVFAGAPLEALADNALGPLGR